MSKLQTSNLKKILNWKLIIGVCLVLGVCFLEFTVKAVKALTITVIPPQLEIEVEPGQVITKTLKVKNEAKESISLNAKTYDFIVNDDKGTPIILEEEDLDNRWASSSWIQLSPTQVKLNPGELVGIQMTIIVPEDAIPGGKYAAVLYSPDNSQAVDQTGSIVNPRAGSLIYLKVKGDIKQDAKITKFKVPSFIEYGPLNVLSTITNLSDIHITPIGAVSIKNLFGKTIANLNLKTTNIFPLTSRDFENSLDRKWLFGRYQSQLEATYGTTGQTLLATAYTWIIPWRLIMAIIIILILIFTILKLLKKDKQKTFVNTPSVELKKKYSDRK